MAEPNKGMRRHSLGAEAGNKKHDAEDDERTQLNKPVHKRPGSSQPKRQRPRVKARQAKLPGRSMRAERRAAEQAAFEASPRWGTVEEQLAAMAEMVDAADLDPNRKQQELVQMMQVDGEYVPRPKVWELQSWMDGGPRCPDEVLEFRDLD